MKKVIIPIHGMCSEIPGYSQEWKDILAPAPEFEWREFFWDFINDDINVDGNLLKGISGDFISLYLKFFDEFPDVSKYSLANRKEPAEALLESFLLNQNADEIIILAHSLGSVLAYETLQKMDQSQLDKIKLCTFGCPLTSSFERWFLDVKVTEIKPQKWINIWGSKDLVGGRPLTIKGFDQKNNFEVVTKHNELEYLTAAKNIITDQLLK